MRSCASGSCGMTRGAKTAASAMSASHRPESHSLGPAFTVMTRASSMAEPRIEQRIAQIDQEINGDEEERKDEDDALDERQIAVDHGIDRHIAETFVGEQPFDDHGPADQESELHAGQSECRNDR